MEIQQRAGPVTILAERMSVFAARLRTGLESIPDCVVPAAARPPDVHKGRTLETAARTAEPRCSYEVADEVVVGPLERNDQHV